MQFIIKVSFIFMDQTCNLQKPSKALYSTLKVQGIPLKKDEYTLVTMKFKKPRYLILNMVFELL